MAIMEGHPLGPWEGLVEGEVGLRIMALLVEEGVTLGEEVVRIQTKLEGVGARIVMV